MIWKAISVSVLLPNYNHAEFLRRSLACLAAQTRPAEEIVIVDDASTDNSLAVIESFRAALPQIHLIRNEKNLGVNRSLNIALAAASGAYVVCTGADDWLEAGFLARMTETAQNFPEAKLLISQYVEFAEAKNETIRHGAHSAHGWWYHPEGAPRSFSAAEFLGFLSRGFVWLPINTALVEKQALLQEGGYDVSLKWHADWFATYAIALRYGFALVPEPLSVFRVADATYCSGMRDKKLQREVCYAMFEKLCQPGCEDINLAMRRHLPLLFPRSCATCCRRWRRGPAPGDF